jgi:pimeloyl-ACP methyl ester carboxylesterase
MEFVLRTGQTLAADRLGAAEAPMVVLLHGLSGNRRAYGVAIHHLTGRVERGELQVLNVDLRGHGRSTRATLATYDAPSYAADIAALIDSLTDQGAVVVGHSLGGVVAATLAQIRSDLVRALFLEDPPFFEGDAERRNASPVASFFPLLVAAVRDLHAKNAALSDYEALALTHVAPDEAAERGLSLSMWDPTAMQAAIEGTVWRGFDPVASFSCPVTILRADPACGAVFSADDVDPVQSANPHAEISMVPAAAHGILTTQPNAYLGEFDAFLDSVL